MGDDDLYNTAEVTATVAILESKNKRKSRAKDKVRDRENYGKLMYSSTGARKILKRKCELIAQNI